VTVFDWNDRGSTSGPWRANYMHRVHLTSELEIRLGFDPSSEMFRCFVQGVGFMHDGFYSRPQDAMNVAEEYAGGRLSSIWLWRLVNDRDASPRAPRVTTRSHEPGPGRYAA
jgi:hypothetical protein